ncbi:MULTISPECIES: hypothetical protein [Nostoc]|uniref:GUN4-like domain-containing protein n=1 Tax=Nostoc paludosum FACHB-159 TaxID=2692908 RepID=A0ABR8KL45_9NOSO|nr:MULTISPECIES: hypothetical protein [Nostoc]MBD2682589.1 hypothetical protein [Nostoc sp. FACHB-857]MBD2738915.1 hypothetical protein [Nostoc paludosum FACHB-159]
MLRIKSFNTAYLYDDDELEAKDEIFNQYKYALAHIGIDFYREDVQEIILKSIVGMEDALRATIAYWYWKQANSEEFEHPNAFLIKALQEQWKPYNWQDYYLDNSNFKNPCDQWWQDAALHWGYDFRNQWVVDINENDAGEIFIIFSTRNRLSLRVAKQWGWERLKEYILEQSQMMNYF